MNAPRQPQDEQLATEQRLYRMAARRRTEAYAIKQVNRQIRIRRIEK